MSVRLNQKGLSAGRQGFTLIELLVVVSIVTILSIIGVAIFTSTLKNARDARRRADIDATAKALEVYKTPSGYQQLQNSQFSSGRVPYDPFAISTTDNTHFGCGNGGSSSQRRCYYCARPALTNNYCTDGSDPGLDSLTTNTTSWIICANLETGNPGYYCKRNSQ